MASRAAALFLLAVGAACSASPTSSLSEPAPSNDVDAAGSDASLPGAGEDGGSDAPATSSDAGPADAGAADGGESIVVVPTCTLPTAPGAGQINTVKGVVYGADAAAQTLDVAWPMAAGLHPLVVLVHGGGWWQGDKSSFVSYAAVLASLGYVAASLDYRLVPADGGANAFPTQVSDVRCAVRHLRANAGTYGIDGARVGALGTSAGAHLAAMLGVGDGVPGLDDGTCPQVVSGQSASVIAAVGFYTPSDLRHSADWAAEAQGAFAIVKISNMLGGPMDSVSAVAALASPTVHAAATTPPFLLLHGTADTLVPPAQSQTFDAALHAAGGRATLVEVPGAAHGFPVMSAQLQPSSCTTLAFLKQYLAP